MGRKYMDCRDIPSEMNCSLRIEGTEDEVVMVATRHAIEDHREKDTPELREMIRTNLKDLDDEGERRTVRDPVTQAPAIV